MHLYIPSMARYTTDHVLAGPASDIPRHMHKSVSYVVPGDEVLLYSEALRQAKMEDVGVLACQESGIAATRLAIGEHARETGHDKFVMMDDDIRFLIRRSEDDWPLRQATEEEVFEMICAVASWIDAGYAHVGVSAREGNNRVGIGGSNLVNECTRTLRFLAYDTEAFLSVEHCRVEVMEDFDVNLQLLQRGRKNVSLHYWSQGQKMTNAPGGCSVYRDHDVHQRSALRLKELHPKYVHLREKKNKTDQDGFGTRTEVTIHWKRAYEENAE